MSYFSTTLKTATTDFANPKAVAGWLADVALLCAIPAIGPAVLAEYRLAEAGDDRRREAAEAHSEHHRD